MSVNACTYRQAAQYICVYIYIYLCVCTTPPILTATSTHMFPLHILFNLHSPVHTSYVSHARGGDIGLFCKRALQKRRFSAKETYDFIDPTDRLTVATP